MSRLPLRLNALHPDRTGGLGFLNQQRVRISAGPGRADVRAFRGDRRTRLARGRNSPQFQFEILAIVVFLMLLVLLPQTFFTIQLEHAWRIGAGEYGVLGSHYVDTFRRKWLGGHPHTRESLVGSADIQSLADMANAFDVIRTMHSVPVTRDTMCGWGSSS